MCFRVAKCGLLWFVGEMEKPYKRSIAYGKIKVLGFVLNYAIWALLKQCKSGLLLVRQLTHQHMVIIWYELVTSDRLLLGFGSWGFVLNPGHVLGRFIALVTLILLTHALMKLTYIFLHYLLRFDVMMVFLGTQLH